MPSEEEIAAFERRNGTTLPATYRAFLRTLDAPARRVDGRGRRVRFVPLIAGKSGSRMLGLEVKIQLGEKSYPFFQLLQSHLEMWREFTGNGTFSNVNGLAMDSQTIESAFCIAEVDGAELIFILRDGSVWQHFHDGCQVEQIAGDIGPYLQECGEK